MIYRVLHKTTLSYSAPVAQAQFNLRLSPWPFPGQQLRECSLSITPTPGEREERSGPYCVNTTLIGFARPLGELDVTSEFTIAIAPRPAPEGGATVARLRNEAAQVRDLSVTSPVPYLFTSRIAEIDDGIGKWAEEHLRSDAPIVQSVSALTQAIHSEFTYRKGATTSDTPPREAFAKREGVCQDFAHIMIMALRSHGIPAAYASGYLRTRPPPGKEKLVGADAMHAWVSAWCGEELGWVGFDPTNNCLAREDHILIAMGRDYADVSPIDGTFIGSAPQKMTSAVDVTPME
jgi:transglutaminase-like putative cysteine protease